MDASILTAMWREHWALISGLLSALFVALRILSVAQYDPMTAYGILQAGGTSNVLIGATLSSIGLLAPVIAANFFYIYDDIENDEKGTVRNVVLAIGVTFALISIAVTPVITEVGQGAIFIVTFPSFHKANRQIREAQGLVDKSRNLDKKDIEQLKDNLELLKEMMNKMEKRLRWTGRSLPVKHLMLALMLSWGAFLVLVVLNTTPWLPAENISVNGGRSVVAYVLSDSGTYTAILAAAPRRIEYIYSSRITARQVCNYQGANPSWLSESFLELLSPARYSSCKA